ncbi:MAG: YicC/YloC family endoribonuclease [Planctomycetaceae bacterium]
MLLSMTGFGHSSLQTSLAHVSAELKSVNNRYLKLSLRLPDSLARFEADIERVIRSRIARGAVQGTIRVRFLSGQTDHQLDLQVLHSYQQQLGSVISAAEIPLAALLTLPGVVIESEVDDAQLSALWPDLERCLCDTLDHFDDFRRREGESMRQDLSLQCDVIQQHLVTVTELSPTVVIEYRDKLLERVRRLMADLNVTLNETDIIREMAIFADRCDINEEITRLKSHIEQFRRMLAADNSQGRKLEFISQEMFREINTIGSKANSTTIGHCVVEMKAAIERIREVLQNVE